ELPQPHRPANGRRLEPVLYNEVTMGLLSKLFGSKPQAEAAPEASPPEAPAHPDAVIVLRRGMSVPKPEYLAGVIASAFPEGLPDEVPRTALAQPSWYKTEEVAEQIAS